jgi:anti-sigma factor ChrR (cupin superfamily)
MRFESLHSEGHEEWAALYAAGALTPEEMVSFEDHLVTGCEICVSRLRDFEAVADQLAVAVSAEPPASLRSKVLARILQEISPGQSAIPSGIIFQKAGLLISRSEEIPWERTPLPGVKIKKLYVDSARKYSTSLVSVEAGSVYPAHRHNDIEEFYVLEGDFSGEGIQMHPGDYCRSEPGTIHGEAKTESGCLLLVWSSNRDELL